MHVSLTQTRRSAKFESCVIESGQCTLKRLFFSGAWEPLPTPREVLLLRPYSKDVDVARSVWKKPLEQCGKDGPRVLFLEASRCQEELLGSI